MSALTRWHQTEHQEALAPASGEPRPVVNQRVTLAGPLARVIPLTDRPDTRHPETDAPPAQPHPPAGHTGTAEDTETEAHIGCLARSVAQGSLEVLGGTRPLQQMSRWLDAGSYERLQLRANLVRSIRLGPAAKQAAAPGRPETRLHRNVTVRSLRTCRITRDIYEVSLVMIEQTRARAVALRLERRRGNWKVTALEIG